MLWSIWIAANNSNAMRYLNSDKQQQCYEVSE